MNSVVKNYSINLIYQIILLIFPIILIPYSSRILGPAAIGEYAYVYTYSLYFIMIAQLGISLFGAKQISINRDDKVAMSHTFWQLFYAKIITTALAVALYLAFILIYVKQSHLLYYFQIILLISTALDISWFYVGNENFKPLLLRNLLIKSLSLIFVIIFVKKPEDVYIYALILFLSEFIGQALMWFKIRFSILVPRKTDFSLPDLFINLRGMFILFIPQFIIQVYTILNNTMLGLFSTSEQVAYYDNATKIINISLTIITSLGIVMLPRIAALNKGKDDAEIRRYIDGSVKMMSFLGIPVMISLMAIGDIFIRLYLGQLYLFVGVLLAFYPLKIFLVIYSNIMGMQYLVPLGKNKAFIMSVLIGAVTSIVLNLFLIEKYGAFGVVISVLIAELLVTITQFIITNKFLHIHQSLFATFKMLISGVTMYIIMLLTKMYLCPQIFILFKISDIGDIYLNLITFFISFLMGGGAYLLLLTIIKDETTMTIYSHIKTKFISEKRRKA